MMLNLYVQQHQWIIISLLCGVALMLLFYLTYAAMWLPRDEEKQSEALKEKTLASIVKGIVSVVPWVIILIALGSVSFTIATLLENNYRPPNW